MSFNALSRLDENLGLHEFTDEAHNYIQALKTNKLYEKLNTQESYSNSDKTHADKNTENQRPTENEIKRVKQFTDAQGIKFPEDNDQLKQINDVLYQYEQQSSGQNIQEKLKAAHEKFGHLASIGLVFGNEGLQKTAVGLQQLMIGTSSVIDIAQLVGNIKLKGSLAAFGYGEAALAAFNPVSIGLVALVTFFNLYQKEDEDNQLGKQLQFIQQHIQALGDYLELSVKHLSDQNNQILLNQKMIIDTINQGMKDIIDYVISGFDKLNNKIDDGFSELKLLAKEMLIQKLEEALTEIQLNPHLVKTEIKSILKTLEFALGNQAKNTAFTYALTSTFEIQHPENAFTSEKILSQLANVNPFQKLGFLADYMHFLNGKGLSGNEIAHPFLYLKSAHAYLSLLYKNIDYISTKKLLIFMENANNDLMLFESSRQYQFLEKLDNNYEKALQKVVDRIDVIKSENKQIMSRHDGSLLIGDIYKSLDEIILSFKHTYPLDMLFEMKLDSKDYQFSFKNGYDTYRANQISFPFEYILAERLLESSKIKFSGNFVYSGKDDYYTTTFIASFQGEKTITLYEGGIKAHAGQQLVWTTGQPWQLTYHNVADHWHKSHGDELDKLTWIRSKINEKIIQAKKNAIQEMRKDVLLNKLLDSLNAHELTKNAYLHISGLNTKAWTTTKRTDFSRIMSDALNSDTGIMADYNLKENYYDPKSLILAQAKLSEVSAKEKGKCTHAFVKPFFYLNKFVSSNPVENQLINVLKQFETLHNVATLLHSEQKTKVFPDDNKPEMKTETKSPSSQDKLIHRVVKKCPASIKLILDDSDLSDLNGNNLEDESALDLATQCIDIKKRNSLIKQLIEKGVYICKDPSNILNIINEIIKTSAYDEPDLEGAHKEFCKHHHIDQEKTLSPEKKAEKPSGFLFANAEEIPGLNPPISSRTSSSFFDNIVSSIAGFGKWLISSNGNSANENKSFQENSFTNTCSIPIDGTLMLAQCAVHYSNFTLPHNVVHKLSKEDRDILTKNLITLSDLNESFKLKKKKRAFLYGVHADLYSDIENLLIKSITTANKMLKYNKKTGVMFSLVEDNIERIRIALPKLTNREIEKALRHEEIQQDRYFRRTGHDRFMYPSQSSVLLNQHGLWQNATHNIVANTKKQLDDIQNRPSHCNLLK
jgi:hypothetical protein